MQIADFMSRPDFDDTQMRTLAYEAFKKGLDLVYEVRPNVPEVVLGDPTRLSLLCLRKQTLSPAFTSLQLILRPHNAEGH